MMKLVTNKKGEVVLRNILIMMIMFAGILALISIFVYSMGDANNYNNAGMIAEYDNLGTSSLGDTLLNDNISSSISVIADNSDSAAGSVGALSGVIKGAGAILKTIITAPFYIGNAVETILTDLVIPNNADSNIFNIIGNMIGFIIYVIIGFVIVSALLRGGRV